MGRLIVIEGLDGSGKATQSQLLLDNFAKADKPATKITFPDYDSPSSTLVKMYLKGELGGLDSVNVYAASSFYAADRYVSYVQKWKSQYDAGHTIIADRYVTSNFAHQMSKLDSSDWDNYIAWLEDFEYTKMQLPKPDLVVYLDMSPATSKKLIEKRYDGDIAKKDIHEKDYDYLLKCRHAALYAADKLAWSVIKCSDDALEKPKPIETIAELIQETIDTRLGNSF